MVKFLENKGKFTITATAVFTNGATAATKITATLDMIENKMITSAVAAAKPAPPTMMTRTTTMEIEHDT